VSPEAVQAEADRLRYERRLESAAATFTWLEEHMITAEEWEAGIYQRLLAEKLAEHLFESEIEKYFAQHRLDYDQLVLYKIIVSSQPVAQELCYQIEDQEISFYDAAHQYNLEEEGRLRCGYLGKLYRWSLKADLATHVFGATPGDVIGPLPSDQGYELLMIEAFIPAELTPEVRQEIRNKLFKEWLDRELNYRIHNTTLEVE
jgi:parvulin-like peptidyl-prolyl isomerase